MNEKRRLVIVYIPVFLLALVVIIGAILFSGEEVQKNISKIELNKSWNKVMADSINKSHINLVVDDTSVQTEKNSLYMSENMELMIPADIVIDTFNCAQNLYDENKLVVEKGSSKAVMTVGENKLKFNENDYKLDESVTKIDGKIYLPVGLFSQYLGYKYEWDSDTNTATLTNEAVDDSFLPERYSYIDAERINNVKDQGNYGTCWAFATLTALETSLMPEEKKDFSEDNLVHNNELSDDIQDGGDYIMSMAYLMAWRGPVLEEEDPYGDNYSDDSLEAVKHVQGAEIIPSKDYKQIKEMVYKYGGVESSMYMAMNNSYSQSVYYNRENSAYCYIGENKPNHDVVIIGWDDNYPKEKFNDSDIDGDGAFICMNSWGEKFGENGVFYISYYDDCIGNSNVCYTQIEDIDNYDKIYQSDLCGWTGDMGFANENTAYFANVFEANENESIKAVGFYAVADDIEYEVFVCENYDGTKSLNDRNHLAARGKIKNKGYYTIPLDKDYNIAGGKKFSVIVKVSRKGKIYKLIPVEMSTDEMTGKVDLSDGEGYFSSEGYNWQSAEAQDCNICLKAYTSNR